jgi:hypothetical protein
LILLAPAASSDAHCRMVIYNADGSRPEMCGNGIRGLAKFVWDRGLVRKNPLRVETDAGDYEIVEIETVAEAAADFSKPRLLPPEQRISRGDVVSSEEISLQEASAALGATALSAGTEVAGLKLARVERRLVKTAYARATGLEPRTVPTVSLRYGQLDRTVAGKSLEIDESLQPQFAFGWAFVRGSPAPAGYLQLLSIGWGFLHRDGVYVVIRGTAGEDAILAAARALRPVGADAR